MSTDHYLGSWSVNQPVPQLKFVSKLEFVEYEQISNAIGDLNLFQKRLQQYLTFEQKYLDIIGFHQSLISNLCEEKFANEIRLDDVNHKFTEQLSDLLSSYYAFINQWNKRFKKVDRQKDKNNRISHLEFFKDFDNHQKNCDKNCISYHFLSQLRNHMQHGGDPEIQFVFQKQSASIDELEEYLKTENIPTHLAQKLYAKKEPKIEVFINRDQLINSGGKNRGIEVFGRLKSQPRKIDLISNVKNFYECIKELNVVCQIYDSFIIYDSFDLIMKNIDFVQGKYPGSSAIIYTEDSSIDKSQLVFGQRVPMTFHLFPTEALNSFLEAIELASSLSIKH